MIKKLRHIGIMVEDFQRAVKKFEGFGLPLSEEMEKKEDGMKIGFFPIGDTLIEFINFSPDKGWDSVHKVVRSQKGALNHLCFEVDNLEESIKDFEQNGAKLLEGSPMKGAHGRVAFFEPETTENVLVEICEI
ncbi:VOC family protein [Thermodesulfobacteriota bacterium]